MSLLLPWWGNQCLKVETLSVLTVAHLILYCMYLLYLKQCSASLLYIINDYQFNFLSRQLSVITHRKKWLILMKSHREMSYILPWKLYSRVCDPCHFVFSACHYGLGGCPHHCRITIVFRAICPVAPGSLSTSHRPRLGFLKEAFGTLYPPGLQ